jgi:hypothetical protein
MNNTNKLLDKYREACSLKTDMAVAAKLGVTRGTVSSWRHEVRHAEPESVETMAKAIGLDPDEWVLRVQAEREEAVNPRRAKVWLRCAQRLAASAAAITLAVIAWNSGHHDTVMAAFFMPTYIHYANLWMGRGYPIASLPPGTFRGRMRYPGSVGLREQNLVLEPVFIEQRGLGHPGQIDLNHSIAGLATQQRPWCRQPRMGNLDF